MQTACANDISCDGRSLLQPDTYTIYLTKTKHLSTDTVNKWYLKKQ